MYVSHPASSPLPALSDAQALDKERSQIDRQRKASLPQPLGGGQLVLERVVWCLSPLLPPSLFPRRDLTVRPPSSRARRASRSRSPAPASRATRRPVPSSLSH